MKMKMATRLVVILALVALSGATVPGQTPATGRVMRDKLTHSQKMLEAIMTSDFALLDRESAELARATEAPGWFVFNSPEYLRQSAAFLHAVQDLAAAAKDRDLDAAATHYTTLMRSCFDCHRYMKNQRIANP
jgi:cytochrome c556